MYSPRIFPVEGLYWGWPSLKINDVNGSPCNFPNYITCFIAWYFIVGSSDYFWDKLNIYAWYYHVPKLILHFIFIGHLLPTINLKFPSLPCITTEKFHSCPVCGIGKRWGGMGWTWYFLQKPPNLYFSWFSILIED